MSGFRQFKHDVLGWFIFALIGLAFFLGAWAHSCAMDSYYSSKYIITEECDSVGTKFGQVQFCMKKVNRETGK